MRKIMLLAIVNLMAIPVFTQTNTFPTSGNVGIGTTSPETKMHVIKENVGIKSTYSTGIIEAYDAHFDIISSPDGTWGSTINLIEGNGTSNTDVWSITRQTTGGAGSSSLYFNFGTLNQHNNPTKVVFQPNGFVGIGRVTPNYMMDIQSEGTGGSGQIARLLGTHTNGVNLYELNISPVNINYNAKGGLTSSNLRLSTSFSDGGSFADGYGNIILEPYAFVGIGTGSPKRKLQVSNGSNEEVTFRLGQSNVTDFTTSPNGSLTINSDVMGSDGVMYLNVRNKNHLYLDGTGNVGIGTTDPGNYKLAVNGLIGATEIQVKPTGTWPDYVFADDYQLRPLSEVESYINENNHLPDVPTEQEVKEQGLNLGEMDAKLLQKIEELTLYTIEQEKKIKELEQSNQELQNLKKEIEELKAILITTLK